MEDYEYVIIQVLRIENEVFMKQVSMYEANDGKLFRDELSALDWDVKLEKVALANQMLQDGSNVYEVLKASGIFWEGDVEEKRSTLEKLTKETGLVIPHWQCSENPGYKVCFLDIQSGKILVHGDTGTWSGAYGSYMGLSDLCRYAEDTFARNVANTDEPELL